MKSIFFSSPSLPGYFYQRFHWLKNLDRSVYAHVDKHVVWNFSEILDKIFTHGASLRSGILCFRKVSLIFMILKNFFHNAPITNDANKCHSKAKQCFNRSA